MLYCCLNNPVALKKGSGVGSFGGFWVDCIARTTFMELQSAGWTVETTTYWTGQDRTGQVVQLQVPRLLICSALGYSLLSVRGLQFAYDQKACSSCFALKLKRMENNIIRWTRGEI